MKNLGALFLHFYVRIFSFNYSHVFLGLNIPVTHCILDIFSHSKRQIKGPKNTVISVLISIVRKQMIEQGILLGRLVGLVG